MGAYGVISVASHIVGSQIARMMDCVVEGAADEAARIHASLSPFFTALFVTTSPIPLKYALQKCGFDCGSLRLPLVDIDGHSASIMDKVLTDLKVDLPIPTPA
jgi:4-hydroxy-tetrahydrodipicolinate synthase